GPRLTIQGSSENSTSFISFQSCTFSSNPMGAVSVVAAAVIELESCMFFNNQGINGAALSFQNANRSETSVLSFRDTDFDSNLATGSGGAVYLGPSLGPITVTFDGSSFLNNSANDGGGLFIGDNTGSVEVNDTRWLLNKGSLGGGVLVD